MDIYEVALMLDPRILCDSQASDFCAVVIVCVTSRVWAHVSSRGFATNVFEDFIAEREGFLVQGQFHQRNQMSIDGSMVVHLLRKC